MAFLQPGHIMDCGVGSRLDATMIAIDGLMLTDLCILKAVGFLLGDENLNILAKGALVALEREDVVGLLFQDFLSEAVLGCAFWSGPRAVCGCRRRAAPIILFAVSG